MCEHCEHNKTVTTKDDNGFDTEFRQSFSSEVEYCKEYAMPCYDAILECDNKYYEEKE